MSLDAPPVMALRPPRAPSWAGSMRALVRRGLRDSRRSTLTWGLTLGAYGGFMAAVYPSIQPSLDQLLKHYPAALKQAFDVTSMRTVEGYIQAEMFSLIVPLALGYFVIHAITGPTVGAEERGELDTVLSLPLSRRVLMASTCVVAALTATTVMVTTGVMTFAVGRLAGTHISAGLVAAGVGGVLPLALLGGGIAAVAAGAMHRGRGASGLALGLLVAMYLIDLVGKLAHHLEVIRWASAFRYYGSPMRDGIDPLSLIGLSAVAAALMIAGALLLERRDVLR
ncbi:MAG TPA: ABC transporter permease subunit [Solirubrobacteraceae bacterium]|nr:ABC transporter permease subunit [Solirubrobacteraceae bacterium]